MKSLNEKEISTLTPAYEAAQRERFRQARLSRDPRFDGQFFVAVKTTGIFCRPVCSARLPFEQNVEYYEYAQSAVHAGFRPCLRCRPDSAPQSAAWKGVGTTFTRACKLLSEQPPQSISTVASRLGISERYLYKVLATRLGMAPQQFQKYSQLIIAKRLLQETRMNVTDIALAAGFSSARRLQEMFAKYFKLAPQALRKRTPVTMTMQKTTILLRYQPPYNWPYVRDFLKSRALENTEELGENSYRRVFSILGGVGQVLATHQPEKNGFAVSVVVDNVQALSAIMENVARVLDLNAVPEIIEKALVQAGFSTSQCVHGIRLPGAWSLFEAGCRAVPGQQVSVTAAIKNTEKVVRELGAETEYGFAFPTPQAIAESELAFLKMPAARKQALRNLADYFVRTSEQDTSDRDLLAIKGIGPWTLDYMMMRGKSEPDRYLGGDLIVRKTQKRLQVTPLAASPWQSYVTLTLWSLSNQRNHKE